MPNNPPWPHKGSRRPWIAKGIPFPSEHLSGPDLIRRNIQNIKEVIADIIKAGKGASEARAAITPIADRDPHGSDAYFFLGKAIVSLRALLTEEQSLLASEEALLTEATKRGIDRRNE